MPDLCPNSLNQMGVTNKKSRPSVPVGGSGVSGIPEIAAVGWGNREPSASGGAAQHSAHRWFPRVERNRREPESGRMFFIGVQRVQALTYPSGSSYLVIPRMPAFLAFSVRPFFSLRRLCSTCNGRERGPQGNGSITKKN